MEIKQLEYEGKTISVYPCGDDKAAAVVLFSFGPCAEEIIANVAPHGKKFNLIEVTGLRWEDELSPWKHPSLRHGEREFGGNAYAFLKEFTYIVLPMALGEANLRPTSIAAAGYSLAGMFALYAGSRANRFDALLSVSGSLWFDGFVEFVEEMGVSKKTRYVYLSLGEREPISKNQRLSTVGAKTEELRDYYLSQGIKTDFVWNEGGHFDNETQRIGAAILAYLDALGK